MPGRRWRAGGAQPPPPPRPRGKVYPGMRREAWKALKPAPPPPPAAPAAPPPLQAWSIHIQTDTHKHLHTHTHLKSPALVGTRRVVFMKPRLYVFKAEGKCCHVGRGRRNKKKRKTRQTVYTVGRKEGRLACSTHGLLAFRPANWLWVQRNRPELHFPPGSRL